MSVQKLQNLKTAIEHKKQEMSRLQGAKESAEDALKEMGFDTVKDAEQALDDLEADIEEFEADIDKGIKAILKEFPDLA